MKSKELRILIINAIPSFILALIISTFFASGGIAENYTGDTWPSPQFFLILLIWLVGLLLGIRTKVLLLSLPLMYLAPVLGIMLASLIIQ